ncbi:TrkH family potassium uptake protein [Rhodalgimonas zhirmunskyi]|uniref:Trk system potassium uptake protein n=1 Tax=Rhodalgimonas zhirmunskyi TaxID=2964767 RepID=A0AAJ1U9X1_9RHOB|nr:TrkH family potassium uptake protein [Rhodoalgimonas zhirmunskyi]MDQ2094500.1 TrkH family potassium uptake protein [Rhodoalgimonas zhirmunskyi]
MNVVVFVNAVLMLLLAGLMAAEALVFGESREVFLLAGVILGALGLFLAAATRGPARRLTLRHTFLLTTSVWLTAGVAGALPLFIWGMGAIDALFESVSGLTTTGATVLSGLDQTPRGILMWRALLQAVGGVGFIVTGMALLPILRTGGMQLFRTESSDKGDKELATATRYAGATLGVYSGLIVLCGLIYHIGGMNVFDAITHALTTLSTGGYSNYDASFGHFDSAFLQWVATFFMLAGAVPFAWYIRALYRRQYASEQVAALLKTLAVVILALTLWVSWQSGRDFMETLRAVSFNLVSVVTTTGYATEDFLAWGPVAITVFFFFTAMGGCTGSTAGGGKMMRWILVFRATVAALRRIRYPHRIITIRYEGRPVSEDVLSGVITFFMFYFLTVAALAVALALTGLDFDTSISGALTAVANVGPGVGTIIGPSGNFAPLDSTAKLLLTFGMFVGRLEMLTVYVLFTRRFWRDF